MKVKKISMYLLLKFFSIFTIFVRRNKKQITFISLRSSKLENDFKMLYEELEKTKKYELKVILLKFEKNISGYIRYAISCIQQLFALSSSALIVLDHNNFVVSNFKHKDVQVLQLWHATGAIKKFGNDTTRDYRVNGYDYVICNSEAFKENYASAFGIDKSQIKVSGVVKTDLLFDEQRKAKNRAYMLEKYPQIQGKKVILYAPTFRGKYMHGLSAIDVDLDYIQKELGKEYILLYKLHPLMEEQTFAYQKAGINCNKEDIYTLFSVCDYLISDYSALIFDFSIYLKPMLFYVPDLSEYKKNPGIYIDYEKKMPGPLVYKEKEIVEVIRENRFSIEKIRIFRDRYFKYQDGASTKRVAILIDKILGICE